MSKSLLEDKLKKLLLTTLSDCALNLFLLCVLNFTWTLAQLCTALQMCLKNLTLSWILITIKKWPYMGHLVTCQKTLRHYHNIMMCTSRPLLIRQSWNAVWNDQMLNLCVKSTIVKQWPQAFEFLIQVNRRLPLAVIYVVKCLYYSNLSVKSLKNVR